MIGSPDSHQGTIVSNLFEKNSIEKPQGSLMPQTYAYPSGRQLEVSTSRYMRPDEVNYTNTHEQSQVLNDCPVRLALIRMPAVNARLL